MWVAPNLIANSSWLSRRSTAMIWVALARAAPMITLMPTPPQPTTATELPGVTLALLTTAPTPVGTQHPIRAAWAMGVGMSMGTQPISGITEYSAKQATLPMWWMRVSPLCSRWVPSSMFAPVAMCWSHTWELPDRQELHRPQAVTKERITCCPGRTDVTPGPTASTVPAPSWPSTTGSAMGASPCMKWRSLRQMPAADFHQYLSLLGVVKFHVLDHQWGLRFVKNGSLQRWSPKKEDLPASLIFAVYIPMPPLPMSIAARQVLGLSKVIV